MDRPGHIDSGDVMRWNANVERRRREHHERRCSEDAVYRRAYERRQEMIQKMQSMASSQLANVMGQETNLRHQKVSDQMAEAGKPQRVKTHEEMIRDMAIMDSVIRNPDGFPVSGIGFGLAIGSMLLADDDRLKQRLKELEEEIPYAEEIRRTEEEFDKELIRMSGFEW